MAEDSIFQPSRRFLSRRDSTIVARYEVLGIWTFGEGYSGDLCPEGGYRAQPSSPFGARPFGPGTKGLES